MKILGQIVFDEKIEKFVRDITEYTDGEVFFYEYLNEKLGEVADSLKLARVEIKYSVAKGAVFTDDKMGAGLGYSDGEEYNNHNFVEESYPVMEMGKAGCVFYSKDDVEWDDADKAIIRFLCQILIMTVKNSHLEKTLKKVAYTDPRTGLPNTESFNSFLEERIESSEIVGYTIGYINMKNFRYVIQKNGNLKAIEVLKRFGKIVQQFLIEGEIIARTGGDNFEVLLKKERYDGLVEYLSNISVPVRDDDGVTLEAISVRGGFYEIVSGDKAEDIVNAASVALNVARSKGTSDFVKLDPYMVKQIMMEKEITTIFPKALRDMEFKVFYQPKVNLEDNRICGAEALVRWLKDGAIIPPNEFIPVLEREGKICSIDFYVLECVCKNIREWLDKGIEVVRISVNFSKLNLYNRHLTEEILSIMNKYGVENKYIEIELTEMSGYEDYEALCVFVDNMKKCGIKTSIDDFGTGYSSFNLIKDLNTDIIKLDRSFLINIDKGNRQHSRTDEIVIKNIVNMVNELDMEVIAEGVENVEQAEFLKKINCLKVQGFLFDKPLPIEEFEEVLCSKKVYSVTA